MQGHPNQSEWDTYPRGCEASFIAGNLEPLEAHHILDQVVGPTNSPFAQRLKLRWVVVGEMCLSSSHKPVDASVCKTYLTPEGDLQFPAVSDQVWGMWADWLPLIHQASETRQQRSGMRCIHEDGTGRYCGTLNRRHTVSWVWWIEGFTRMKMDTGAHRSHSCKKLPQVKMAVQRSRSFEKNYNKILWGGNTFLSSWRSVSKITMQKLHLHFKP